jgi:hypothetical protein
MNRKEGAERRPLAASGTTLGACGQRFEHLREVAADLGTDLSAPYRERTANVDPLDARVPLARARDDLSLRRGL